MKGNVYVLSNKSLPGIYKIGITSRSPYVRADELSTTGLPTEFKVEYYITVDEYDLIEKRVHAKLSNENAGKEFFKCRLEKCISTVRIESDTHKIYGEKFKNNTLMKSVYKYESSNNINIDKNIMEHNRKLEQAKYEQARLQKIKEEQIKIENMEKEEKARISREKWIASENEKRRIKKEKKNGKALMGLSLLFFLLVICGTYGKSGYTFWIVCACIYGMWYLWDW